MNIKPHDTLFKQSMQNLDVAKDLLMGFARKDIKHVVDWATLKTEKGSFLDSSNRALEADIVYSVSRLDNDSRIYFLIEQQSNDDTLMPIRLNEYTQQIYRLHLKQYGGKYIPAVYPIVVYSGDRAWTAKQQLYDMVDQQDEIAKSLFASDYRFINLDKCNDNELDRCQLAGPMLWVLKHHRDKNPDAGLESLVEKICRLQLANANEYVTILLQYIASVFSVQNKDAVIRMLETVECVDEEGVKMRETIADYLRREGMQQGMQQGRQEAYNEVVGNMLKARMEPEIVSRLTGVPLEAINDLTVEKNINEEIAE